MGLKLELEWNERFER